jgi:hypothetical protein
MAKLFGKPLEEVLLDAGFKVKKRKSSKDRHHTHFPTPPMLKQHITLNSEEEKPQNIELQDA